MNETVEIKIGEESFKLPVIVGSYQEKGIDISKLRGMSGYVTLDTGFKNTGSTRSTITFIDGEKGILEHRGYRIEQLAENSSFLEIVYLLFHEKLPNTAELAEFEQAIKDHTGLPAQIRDVLNALPDDLHPMGMLSVMLNSLPGFMPESLDSWTDEAIRWKTIYTLLANMPVMAAYIYRRQKGLEYIDPDTSLGYVENFLNMTFGSADAKLVESLDTLLILHADHEQNCSASTARFVGSSHVNLFAAIGAANNALWGPLHGGANQKVLEMLEAIRQDGGDADKYIQKAKDKSDPFRLMGFGHRVYKNYDPRARVIKKYVDQVLDSLNLEDPVVDIAKGLEQAALNDEYFAQRKLFPNVDFYSGIIYRALGIPVNMFTVMFALGRLPGWIAQWKEMRENGEPIGRPRQIYTGETTRDYVELGQR
ncbi:citrate synthase [Pontibacter sp. G13]|uniref:citrate synthase n=1 Tax=Pontibacter sp. G13 TaxID=3074898 RepID=UPI0039065ED0